MSTVAEQTSVVFGDHLVFVVVFHKSTEAKFINETFRDALMEVTSELFVSHRVKSCWP